MKFLVAPNSFKGCLSASEAAQEIARGIRRMESRASIDLMPISDGGDGLMEVLLEHWGGRRISCKVMGPLHNPHIAKFALLKDCRTAVIEMAQASGIAGLKRKELDPYRATSFGTGQLIRDALRRGARKVIVGMGGSATNDGGAGMAAALGAKLLDRAGRPLPLGAEPLRRLAQIIPSPFFPPIEVIAVSDVTNPLLGPRGSARVYGPQKGATPAMVRVLDIALTRYAKVLKKDLGCNAARIPGSGAAGGLGAGLLAFLRAKIVPGADWVLDQLGADQRLRRADAVFTGEGKLDAQSFYGKAPIALARRAWARKIPVTFICGQIDSGVLSRLEWRGYLRSLIRSDETAEQAMRHARTRLRTAAEDMTRGLLKGGPND